MWIWVYVYVRGFWLNLRILYVNFSSCRISLSMYNFSKNACTFDSKKKTCCAHTDWMWQRNIFWTHHNDRYDLKINAEADTINGITMDSFLFFSLVFYGFFFCLWSSPNALNPLSGNVVDVFFVCQTFTQQQSNRFHNLIVVTFTQ